MRLNVDMNFIMKRDTLYRWVTLLGVALVAMSCSTSRPAAAASYSSDDMYNSHNRAAITARQALEYDNRKRLEEYRMTQWAEILGVDVDKLAREGEAYNTPYGEKLRSLSADKYERPASYYKYEYEDALKELAKYDPAEYNASIDYNGELSISPKYMSSIYGMWSLPYYDNYSWVYGYPSFGYPAYGYYSMWGYPYSNFGYGVGFGFSYSYYNPWWGIYPGYGYGWGYPGYGWGWGYPAYGWYPPIYRPGAVGARRSIVQHANPYAAPSSSVTGARRANGSTVGRTSSGYNNYNRSATQYRTPSYNTPSRAPSMPSHQMSAPIHRNSIGR